MLIIRLQRVGKKHQPQFRIILAEKHKAASKKFLEILGNYNPRTKEFSLKDTERVKYWLGQNVELSATVHNLLVDQKLIENQGKRKAWAPKKKEQTEEEAQAAQASSPANDSESAPAKEEDTPKAEEAVEAEVKAEEPKEEAKEEATDKPAPAEEAAEEAKKE